MASESEKNDGHRLGHASHIHTNGENMLPSEEIEGKEDGEDLEEGEIEDDEEEVKPPEPSSVVPAAAENGTIKPSHAGEESEKKSRHHSERGRRGDDDDRHKRRRKKRKRGHGPEEDDEPKRRRRGAGPGQEEELEEGGIDDEDDDEDPDMMYVRGNSPVSKAADVGPYDEGYGPGPGPGPHPYGANESPYNSDDSDFRRSASPPRRGDRGPRSKNRRTRGSAREERSRRNRDREAKDRSDRRDRNDRSERRRNEKGGKSDTICGFYLEGKCSRDNDCPFSHAAVPPRKLELCKFYLMECCAKKEKCLYMHKDFPCKFFHTGRKCRSASAAQCKFSHDPLSDTTRAILIKHLESAPKEILGDFPRLTREEAVEAIDNTVNGVLIPRDKRPHIPSIFEQMNKATAAPAAAALADPLGLGGKDVDMRDVDYRFPNPEAQQQWAAAAQQFQQQQQSASGPAEGSKGEQETGTGVSRPRFYQEQGVTAQVGGDSPNVPNLAQNVSSIASPEAEKETKAPAAGIWFRQLQDTNGSDYHSDGGLVMDIPGDEVSAEAKKEKKSEDAKKVEEVKKEKTEETANGTPMYAAVLPPKQPDLYERLQAAAPKIKQDERSMEEDTTHDENWYSSDEETQGKSLTDILKKINSADKAVKLENVPSTGLGQNVNLSSLSNLNLSNISPDDLAQMLSVIKSKAVAKTGKISPEPSSSTSAGQAYRDPRLSRDPRMRAGDVDLRVRSTSAAAAAFRGVDQQPQDIDLRLCPAPIPPSVPTPGNSNDVDLRAALSRPLGNLDDIGSDVDLRRLSGDLLHSFKPPPLLPPAKEIEASIHAHAPIDYHVIEMQTSWPNYTNIRFNPADPQALNDPRLNRSKHGHSPNDRAFPAIQEVPLGPASPDPPSRTSSGGGYGYGPEIGSPDQSSVHNRRDPRMRDVRRMPTDRASLLPTPPVVNPVYAPPPSARDPRGKPGLLGPAPPGMPVVGGEGPPHHWAESNAPSYAPRQEEYSAGGAMGGGINRRDPRQIRRVSNETNNSGEERSKTPPLKSVFREKDPTASPFS